MSDVQCAFCNKPTAQVFRLIAGPTCSICNECVARCLNMLADELKTQPATLSFISPEEDGA